MIARTETAVGQMGDATVRFATQGLYHVRFHCFSASDEWEESASQETPSCRRRIAKAHGLPVRRRNKLGHIAGFECDGDAKDVIGDALATGTRRTPTAADVKQANTAEVNRPTRPVKVAMAHHRRPVRRR